jgi:hypothetical protein
MFASLCALAALGCQPTPAVSPSTPRGPSSTTLASWSEPLSGVSLIVASPAWVLTPMQEAGGAAGVALRVSPTCHGHLWRKRVSEAAQHSRAAALERRLRARLSQLDVTDIVVRDRGDVAHGTFLAFMMRVDGQRASRAWSGRLVGTFVTRAQGRFYVEVLGTSHASDFVARRTCFDTLAAAVTIRAELR